jgi:glycine cleavage system H protein
VGKSVKAGKSVATVESGKWVGPVKTPFAGEIVAANREVENDATILNRSPYKQGWIVRIQPSNFDENSGDLVSGDDAISGFDSYMAEKEIGDCKHCEGFEG